VLCDLGAEVIKVEALEGDITRFAVPRVHSLAHYHVQQNAGKLNISLDVRRDRGRQIVRDLAARSDVVIENFRAGVADRLGIGYDDLRLCNDRLIYGTITGYGQESELKSRRAYARALHAELGIVAGDAKHLGHEPTHTIFAHGDLYPSLQLVIGVLAAVRHRDLTGLGQRVDISMAQTLLYANEFAAVDASGISVDEELGSVGRGRDPIFRTATGVHVTVSGNPCNPGVFRIFCGLIGERLAADPQFATYDDRREHEAELLHLIQEWILTLGDPESVERVFADTSLAFGVVRDPLEIVNSRWASDAAAYRDAGDRHGGSIRIPGSPWRFSQATGSPDITPAYRGEHNGSVLRDVLGMSQSDIDALVEDGVMSSRVPMAEEGSA
jgi:crotonobetainyl-CoA:carnitine CoA-transferase CaiB-like acyl-CoA transferase